VRVFDPYRLRMSRDILWRSNGARTRDLLRGRGRLFYAEFNGDGIVDLLYYTDEERGAAVAAMSASRQFNGSGGTLPLISTRRLQLAA
jgi:hypothetical protein